jgi:hypothetical protein
MAVSLISFAFAKGLPKEADLVFDARFLRNPHYDPILRPRTGLDPEVGRYIREDADYAAYLSRISDLIDLVLPRFVREGKKYATIAVGCTGGRHRSVFLIESLATHMASRLAAMRAAGESGLDWRQTVTHRDLSPDSWANAPLHGEALAGASLPRETDPRASNSGDSHTGDSPAGIPLPGARSVPPNRAPAGGAPIRGEVRVDGDGDKDRAGSGTGDLKTDHGSR